MNLVSFFWLAHQVICWGQSCPSKIIGGGGGGGTPPHHHHTFKSVLKGWTSMYALMVLSLSMKFIKNSHQNLPIHPIFRDKASSAV